MNKIKNVSEKKFCIIKVGQVNQKLRHEYSYSAMFAEWLKPHLGDWSFTTVSIVTGEDLPAPSDFDAYLITGSARSVCDEIEWLKPLENFLCELKQLLIPVVGVCFGHQLLAQANGGVVQKSEKGWGVGLQQYHVEDDADNLPKTLANHCFHQDQITVKPPSARNLASNPHCVLAILKYDFPAISMQFHPEFDATFCAKLIDACAGEKFDKEFAKQARNTITGKDDNYAIGKWVGDFVSANSL